MSERPFMQLYVSDYLGDTRHLSCEQHGAYLLLLMTMWNASGALPDDDTKLARIVCMSVKKWRSIRDDILAFFSTENGVVTHSRLTKELQKSESKSQSRASAGAKGGTAKALKDKKPAVAIATPTPQHLPETIKVKEPPSGGSKNRAARLPKDWQIPEAWIDEAVAAGLSRGQAFAEANRMRNWSIGDRNGAKLDWLATWRNWFDRAARSLPRAASPPQPKPKTKGEMFLEDARQMFHDQSSSQSTERLAASDPGRNHPSLSLVVSSPVKSGWG